MLSEFENVTWASGRIRDLVLESKFWTCLVTLLFQETFLHICEVSRMFICVHVSSIALLTHSLFPQLAPLPSIILQCYSCILNLGFSNPMNNTTYSTTPNDPFKALLSGNLQCYSCLHLYALAVAAGCCDIQQNNIPLWVWLASHCCLSNWDWFDRHARSSLNLFKVNFFPSPVGASTRPDPQIEMASHKTWTTYS